MPGLLIQVRKCRNQDHSDCCESLSETSTGEKEVEPIATISEVRKAETESYSIVAGRIVVESERAIGGRGSPATGAIDKREGRYLEEISEGGSGSTSTGIQGTQGHAIQQVSELHEGRDTGAH